MKSSSKGRVAALAGASLLAALTVVPRAASADPSPAGSDVALASAGAVASSSGREVPNALGPELAIDGIYNSDASRWSGEPADNGWFQVELAQAYRIDHVDIQWSTSCPTSYKLEVSNDGVNWLDATGALTPPSCRAWDTTDLTNLAQPYRYVRMQGIQRSLSYGYSINEFEVWDGPEPPVAASVATGAATNVLTTKATLNGTIDPMGTDTKYQFEYGTTTDYGHTALDWGADVGADSAEHDLSYAVTNLTPGTTYHYRLVAQVGAQSVAGSDQRFTTPQPFVSPPGVTLTPTPASISEHEHAAPFVLDPKTRVIASGPAAAVARPLARQLRDATGYRIRVTHAPPPRADRRPARSDAIEIAVDRTMSVPGFGGNDEAYTLTSSQRGISIAAPSRAGAFYGVQSLRQLLPAFVESPTPVNGPWTVPALNIVDGPRFGYRGIMLDLARNFLSAKEIKRFIDQMSYLKLNVLHLHLSDDQGWRIEITNKGRAPGDHIDYERLTDVSGRTAIVDGGTDGLPGQTGFLTQAQYRAIVAYAAAHQITVIPEIDLPGHSSAILHAVPQLNTANSVPQPPPGQDTIPADGSQNVGQSSLDTHAEVTYTFLAHVFKQLAAMTPGPYIHIGGDEARSTAPADYDYFMKRVIGLVHQTGKSTSGWNLSYADAGANSLTGNDLIQYYNSPDTATAADAISDGTGVVVSDYRYTYLDYPYSSGDFDTYYDWDVDSAVPDVPSSAIRGVEAPLWTETLRSDAEAEYQTWPRAAALAEVGWSPAAHLNEADFAQRLADLGDRWTLQGTNFYPSPLAPWQLAGAATDQTVRAVRTPRPLHLGTALAPGTSLGEMTVRVDWGDGTAPSPAVVSLDQPADGTHVNGAYQISGSHRYPTAGRYLGHLVVSDQHSSITIPFTVHVQHRASR